MHNSHRIQIFRILDFLIRMLFEPLISKYHEKSAGIESNWGVRVRIHTLGPGVEGSRPFLKTLQNLKFHVYGLGLAFKRFTSVLGEYSVFVPKKKYL